MHSTHTATDRQAEGHHGQASGTFHDYGHGNTHVYAAQ
jgi:hypothetical protein